MRCPVCKSNKANFFATKLEYKFYRCNDCMLVFLSILPSQRKLQAYYAVQFSYQDGLINEGVIRERNVRILAKLKELAPSAQTVCDVGSGYGFFLDDAKKAGYKVYGIEPSKKLSKHSRREYSIKTFEGTLQKYTIGGHTNHAKFDIVVCIHVVEHIVNPHKFLIQLCGLVKPGGILYLETPNSDSHLLYTQKDKYTFLIPPEHLWLFSGKSLTSLLPRSMKVVYSKTYSYPEHFMGILKSLFKKNDHNQADCVKALKKSLPIRTNPLREFLKKASFLILDKSIAPLLTGILNSYHKGSILELYYAKK